MTEETTTEQLAEIEGQTEDTPAMEYTPPEGWRVLAVGERLRDGDVTVRRDGYQYPTERVGGWVGSNQRYIRPIEPQPQSEPVRVPEPQAADTPVTEYTPPEGWRVLQSGELLQPGDHWVNWEGTVSRPDIQHGDGATVSGGRCIRRIEPEPQPQPEPVQVREGRWRTRGGDIRDVIPTPNYDERATKHPWYDAKYDQAWQNNGCYFLDEENHRDLVKYLGPIEAQPEPHAATIEELRSEVSYVQNLLGESRQRVTQLEDLVGSLRTINAAQEAAVEAAGKQNDALRAQVRILQREADKKNSRIEFLETLNAGNGAAISDYRAQVQKLQGLVDTARGQLETAATEHDSLSTQLEAVKAELVTQAETSRRLQIELDAAQQVPPAIADRFQEGWNQGTARAVETVLEWLEPIRLVDSAYLANATMQHLPQIMRSLTGLDSHAID